MSAEPINEATDAELDAKMLRELRDFYRDHPNVAPIITCDEMDMFMRIADERDALRRAFCEEPEKPNPYLILSCHYCGHATHGAGFLCHDSKTCACRGDL